MGMLWGSEDAPGFPRHALVSGSVAAGCASGNSSTGRIVARDAVAPSTAQDTPKQVSDTGPAWEGACARRGRGGGRGGDGGGRQGRGDGAETQSDEGGGRAAGEEASARGGQGGGGAHRARREGQGEYRDRRRGPTPPRGRERARATRAGRRAGCHRRAGQRHDVALQDGPRRRRRPPGSLARVATRCAPTVTASEALAGRRDGSRASALFASKRDDRTGAELCAPEPRGGVVDWLARAVGSVDERRRGVQSKSTSYEPAVSSLSMTHRARRRCCAQLVTAFSKCKSFRLDVHT